MNLAQLLQSNIAIIGGHVEGYITNNKAKKQILIISPSTNLKTFGF